MRRIIIALALLLMSVFFVLGQADTTPDSAPPLMITVSNQSCAMALVETDAATPEATAEAQATSETESVVAYPTLTPGDDCADVLPLLYAPTNGTLWIALWLPDEFPWQQFEAVEGDEHPPKLDTRGRYVGCANPETGEHICRVLWEYDDVTYLIEVPLLIGNAYTPPATDVPTTAPETENSGVWGDCGSCSTCGGPVEHCVLAPDNQCLWDAARCEKPPAAAPATTPDSP